MPRLGRGRAARGAGRARASSRIGWEARSESPGAACGADVDEDEEAGVAGWREADVRAWIDADPDEGERAELEGLLAREARGDRRAEAELADRFAGPLRFGTAGLRGLLGSGPNRMNRAVVIQAAAGLAAWLRAQVGAGFRVVVGRDARRGSEAFAHDTARVVQGAGGHAMLLPRPLPTPVTAFALRELDADAAVMVTASHNPPAYNGYKVYLGGRAVTGAGRGSQIVPPQDLQIEAAIRAAGPARAIPLADGFEVLSDDVWHAYVRRAVGLAAPGPRDLRVVLTSLHGVGGKTALAVLSDAGFEDVRVVADQQRPNPDFPGLAFPNPEEPGVLDRAMELARRANADLVLANDPDADRCAVAVPDEDVEGGWRQLSGDQVGALLGEEAARAHEGDRGAVLANSLVSSRLLGRIAAAHGVGHAVTPTGFKWISRVPGLVFGYEEAIGYCVDPAAVHDKDGITAGLALAVLAARLKAEGSSLRGRLDDLARRFGLYATAPLTIRVRDTALIARGMGRLRADPPRALGGSPVVDYRDLARDPGDLPGTDALWFRTESDDRVVVRPSGTEPKLKCYLECIVPARGAEASEADPGSEGARGGARAAVDRARARAADRLARISAELREELGI